MSPRDYLVTDEVYQAVTEGDLTGTLIRSWRNLSGLTIVQLSKLLGYQNGHIQRMETGRDPVTPKFTKKLRELAGEMHKLGGLPEGALKIKPPPKNTRYFTLDNVAGAENVRWDYCQNPKCPKKGRLQLFLSNRTHYCNSKCAIAAAALKRTDPGLIPRYKKVRKVLCPHCGRGFPITGHVIRDPEPQAPRQAPHDAERQMAGAANGDALPGLLRPTEGGVQSDDQIPELRENSGESHLSDNGLEIMGNLPLSEA